MGAMAKALNSSPSPWALTIAGGISAAYLAHLAIMALAHRWITDAHGAPFATDFISFWSAGHLALAGEAAQAYDWPTLHALQRDLMHGASAGFFGWAYPPLFLLVAMVLAVMPYGAAFLCWVGVSLALYLTGIVQIARTRGAALLAFAAPATLACAMVGQNGFFTAALMAGILLQLETRPLLAGLFLGFLSYKPHFGLLFPIALIFGGYWRAFASAAATTLTILLFSWLFAPDSLAAFAAHLGGMSNDFLSQGHAGFNKLQSLYGLLRMSGVADRTAFAAQGLLSIGMAAFVAWLWRGPAEFSLKCAGLCAATLPATPYLFLYDFPILAVAIAFLWRARTFDRVEIVLLAASQIAIALFVVAPSPVGLAGSFLVFVVIIRRLGMPTVRTAPLAQLARRLPSARRAV